MGEVVLCLLLFFNVWEGMLEEVFLLTTYKCIVNHCIIGKGSVKGRGHIGGERYIWMKEVPERRAQRFPGGGHARVKGILHGGCCFVLRKIP